MSPPGGSPRVQVRCPVRSDLVRYLLRAPYKPDIPCTQESGSTNSPDGSLGFFLGMTPKGSTWPPHLLPLQVKAAKDQRVPLTSASPMSAHGYHPSQHFMVLELA